MGLSNSAKSWDDINNDSVSDNTTPSNDVVSDTVSDDNIVSE